MDIIELLGWVYMGITMFGSVHISVKGESRLGWGIYITAASIGIIYFASMTNTSQLLLLVYFGIMNVTAFVRLTIKKHDKRDLFFHRMENGHLRAICLYNGVVAPKCPNNNDSMCRTELFDYPRSKYHEFDGKNVWKCDCG
jgi:hypothetical protein